MSASPWSRAPLSSWSVSLWYLREEAKGSTLLGWFLGTLQRLFDCCLLGPDTEAVEYTDPIVRKAYWNYRPMIAKPNGCRACPLFSKGNGFCLDWGNPKTAMIALNLETPANNEISHLLDPTDKMDREEIARRKIAFPQLEYRHINKGEPIVGRSGWLIDQWILRAAGILRKDLFLANTLRCFPPKGKNDSHYPIGEERKEAERICRQYDRWKEFKPQIAVISMHPASLLRDPSPLSLIVEDFKKMRDFAKQGFKVIGLLGGKSAKQFLKYGETVTRFRGHFQWLEK